MTKQDIWVVVPAYNEAAFISKVLKKLTALKYPFVVVDDGSDDQTLKIARRCAPHVLTHQLNLGKGAALKTGCEYAFNHGAQAVIFMDSDAQHSPDEIKLFSDALLHGHQVVLGTGYFGPQMPLIKIVSNRLASVLVYMLFGCYVPDIPNGYKAMTLQAYQQVRWQSSGYDVELEIAVRVAKHRIPFVTVPVETIYVDTIRGFQFLDSLTMLGNLLLWRLRL